MNAKRQVAQYIISDLVSTNIGWLLFNIFRYYLLPINKEIASLSVYLSYRRTNTVPRFIFVYILFIGVL